MKSNAFSLRFRLSASILRRTHTVSPKGYFQCILILLAIAYLLVQATPAVADSSYLDNVDFYPPSTVWSRPTMPTFYLSGNTSGVTLSSGAQDMGFLGQDNRSLYIQTLFSGKKIRVKSFDREKFTAKTFSGDEIRLDFWPTRGTWKEVIQPYKTGIARAISLFVRENGEKVYMGALDIDPWPSNYTPCDWVRNEIVKLNADHSVAWRRVYLAQEPQPNCDSNISRTYSGPTEVLPLEDNTIVVGISTSRLLRVRGVDGMPLGKSDGILVLDSETALEVRKKLYDELFEADNVDWAAGPDLKFYQREYAAYRSVALVK
jgi:hypothetical protein